MKGFDLWYADNGRMYYLHGDNISCSFCEKALLNNAIFYRGWDVHGCTEFVSCDKCFRKLGRVPDLHYEELRIVWIVDEVPSRAIPVLRTPPMLCDRKDSWSLFAVEEYKSEMTVNHCHKAEDLIEGAKIGNDKSIEDNHFVNDIDCFLLQQKKSIPLLEGDERRLLE